MSAAQQFVQLADRFNALPRNRATRRNFGPKGANRSSMACPIDP